MKFLRTTLEKDLRRLMRDPASIAISITIPLVLATLLRLISGSGGENTPTAKLLIADNDDTFISNFLSGAMAQEGAVDIIHAEAVTEQQGRTRIEAGGASGLLIIPEGFGDKLLLREPVTLSLITNPSQNILPKILEEALAILVDLLNGVQNILDYSVGPLLDRLIEIDGAPDNALVAEISIAANKLANTAQPYLFPPVIEVETRVIEETKKKVTIGTLFFPSMCFLSIIFVAQTMSDDLWKEKALGTLRRMISSPQSLTQVMIGKSLVAALVFFVVALAAFGAGRAVLGIPFENVALASLWATLGGLCMFAIFSLLQIFASSQRAGGLLTTAFLFPLVMIGGAFFPFEVMPSWMVRVGQLTPNGLALKSLKQILEGTIDPASLAISASVLMVILIVTFSLVLGRMRRFAVS